MHDGTGQVAFTGDANGLYGLGDDWAEETEDEAVVTQIPVPLSSRIDIARSGHGYFAIGYRGQCTCF